MTLRMRAVVRLTPSVRCTAQSHPGLESVGAVVSPLMQAPRGSRSRRVRAQVGGSSSSMFTLSFSFQLFPQVGSAFFLVSRDFLSSGF